MIELIRKLNLILDKKDKRMFILLFFLIIVGALFETVGIGLIVPFINMINNTNIIFESKYSLFIYNQLGFTNTNTFLLFCAFCLLLIYVFKNLYIFFFSRFQYRFVYSQQVKLSTKIFDIYLKKPYIFHLQNNSADLLRNINIEVKRIIRNLIIPGLLLVSEICIIAFIVILMLSIAPQATLLAAGILIVLVAAFLKVFRKRMNELGKLQQISNGHMIKWINQGLGACKEIKAYGKEEYFVRAFNQQSKVYAHTTAYYDVLNMAPRLFIETVIVVVILLVLVLVIIQEKNTDTLIAILGLFAMASFRILPSITRIVNAITSIRYNKFALDVIYNDLTTNKTTTSNLIIGESTCGIKLTQGIELIGVEYRYPQSGIPNLHNINLFIPAGKSIAFVGPSGSGKTTLIDLILGVLELEKGDILIDGIKLPTILSNWRRSIGYIPQNIYLTDDSFKRNVAFGVPDKDIDEEAVWRALDAAKLKDFVEKQPDGIDTYVGEKGVRISGGERQRLGIARALYHNPEILFLDEATSALDTETEREIMSSVYKLKGSKTIIIVAHRLSTIERCDIIYEIQNGTIVSVKYN